MLTSSYHMDFVEEVLHLILEVELSFKGVFIFKVREQCLSVRDVDTKITSAHQTVNLLILCLMMM